MSELLKAIDNLAQCVVMADCIGQAFDAACGDNPPPWIYVYREQIEAIREASDQVECLVRRGEHATA
jgi:hypothetical protein